MLQKYMYSTLNVLNVGNQACFFVNEKVKPVNIIELMALRKSVEAIATAY